MTRTRTALVAVLLVASLVFAACGSDSRPTAVATPAATMVVTGPPTVPPGPSISPPRATRPLWGDIALLPLDRTAGIEALAHIEANDRVSPAELTLIVRLPPGGPYAFHLHGGSCVGPGASSATLGSVSVGPSGHAQLAVTRLAGPGGAQDITLALLADADHAIDLHDPSGVLLACGDIPTVGIR